MNYKEILELALQYLSVLIWPIVVLIIFWVLRRPLKDFIGRIIKFAVGDISAETISSQKQGESSEKSPVNTFMQKRTGEQRLEKALSSFSLKLKKKQKLL